jgi:hypothetical protein
MDLWAASALVKVASENFTQYPPETQRSLLEGIFDLAHECKEELEHVPANSTTVHLTVTLGLLKSLISDAIKAGEFAEGFRQARQCFWPIDALNFERCKVGG